MTEEEMRFKLKQYAADSPEVAAMMDGKDIDTMSAEEMQSWLDKIASMGKSLDLVAFGGEVKALGNGKIGGYLIRFSDANTPDLTGDYFDAKTQIYIPDTLPLLYNHGMDGTLKKRIIGKVSTKIDNVGAWADSQLNMRDDYEKAVYAMVEAGKLGYSSGALSHLVDREPVGKSMHIKTWFVGEASLTPVPAEPRNNVVALKSIPQSNTVIINNKENKMTEDEIKAIAEQASKAALESYKAEQKALETKVAEEKAIEDRGYQKAITELKKLRIPNLNLNTELGFSEEKDAVPAFKNWMQTGHENQGLIRPDATFNIQESKAAWNVTTGGSGGFLVPDPLNPIINEKRDLSSWVRQAPVQKYETPSDHLLVPRESTKMTAFTLTAEGISYNEDEGTVSQKDLILYKYTKLNKVNEEFLMYQGTNWESWFSNALGRSVAVTENTIFTAGAGTTEPEGISVGATASAITIKTSAQLNPEDLTAVISKLGAGYNVPSECGFIGANGSKWYLKNAVLAGPFAWATNNGMNGAPDFFGYNWYTSDDVLPYTTAAASIVMLFGNLNYYGIVEKPGIIVQRNPYLFMGTGQIGIYASIFRGGGVLQAEAIYSVNGK